MSIHHNQELKLSGILEELQNKWGDIIVSRRALRGIAHIIYRAIQFNNKPMPATIEVIHVGGSSILGSLEPEDLDVVVEAYKRGDVAQEWREFKEHLRRKFGEVWGFINELRLILNKVTINHLIAWYRSELEDLGFKSLWINEWMPWVRITDYQEVIDRGVMLSIIDEYKLIRRFLKYGWKGLRIEIHIEGDFHEALDSIPRVTIWKQSSGILSPSRKLLEKFYIESFERVRDLTFNILEKNYYELPFSCQLILHALEAEPPKTGDRVLKQIYKKALKELKAILDELNMLASLEPSTAKEAAKQALNLRLLQKKAIAVSLLILTLNRNFKIYERPSESPLETISRLYLNTARREYGIGKIAREVMDNIIKPYKKSH